MLTFSTLTDFAAHVGKPLGESDYLTVTQEMVNQFADATGDHQWIHIDTARAARESPYRTTIAHGFLTLSLAPKLMETIYRVESVKMGINYGTNKVRFTGAVPVGSRLRLSAVLQHVEPQPAGAGTTGLRVITDIAFQLEGSDKPACVAEWITLLFE
nr:MaoC family dehydratase [uncultured Arsenicibacter sp.]